MLAAPAWATTVNIWFEPNESAEPNEVEIWYETDVNLPRAFALEITVTDGNIIDIKDYFEGECDDVNKGYGIFPGTIVISGDAISDYGSPVAPDDDPGAEGTGLDTNTIIIEMGSLYAGANTPDPCALLCRIVVSLNCEVELTENETRGGVVMENPDEIPTVVLPSPYSVTGVSRWVPDVVGMYQPDACDAIEAEDLVVGDVTWDCNHTVAYDYVLSQSPEDGTEVEQGTYVDLLKSLGPPHVPDVVNEPNLAAQAAIEDVCGLSVGDITAECNDTIPAGNVISTNPAYCNYPDCGTAVDIVVSTGPCPACVVPGVIDMTQADACDAIVAAGYVLGAVTESNECGVVGDFNVISSTPAAGIELECGQPVNIVICECYYGQPDYSEWEAVGKPICWCYPRQCHGDADGLPFGKFNYWTSNLDLTVMKDAWNKPAAQLVGNEACADFDHLPFGKFDYRVSNLDLAILKDYWNIADGPDPNCQPGDRTP